MGTWVERWGFLAGRSPRPQQAKSLTWAYHGDGGDVGNGGGGGCGDDGDGGGWDHHNVWFKIFLLWVIDIGYQACIYASFKIMFNFF